MKKLLVLLLFSLSVKAQQAGIRAGVAVSNLSNTDFSAHTGYYAAFTGHLSSKGIYSLQPEMGIMRLGAKGEAVGSNGQTSQAIVADYVFLNIMNKISFHPSFGILIGPGFEQEMSNSSYLRKQSSLALNLGLALSLPGGIGFEARVRRGLRDLYNGAQAREQETQLLPFGENSFLSFQAGLFFKFPK
jgi:hypothetical protein